MRIQLVRKKHSFTNAANSNTRWSVETDRCHQRQHCNTHTQTQASQPRRPLVRVAASGTGDEKELQSTAIMIVGYTNRARTVSCKWIQLENENVSVVAICWKKKDSVHRPNVDRSEVKRKKNEIIFFCCSKRTRSLSTVFYRHCVQVDNNRSVDLQKDDLTTFLHTTLQNKEKKSLTVKSNTHTQLSWKHFAF